MSTLDELEATGAVNQETDPRCSKLRSTWCTGGQVVTTEARTVGNHPYYAYWLDGKVPDTTTAKIFPWASASALPVGTVLFLCVRGTNTDAIISGSVEGCEPVTTGVWGEEKWMAHRVTTVGNHTIDAAKKGIILTRAGVFSEKSWEKVMSSYQRGSIPLPWFGGPRYKGANQPGAWED